MSKKRDRLDIIFDMFMAIQNKGGSIKPTHLMYKANLSHTQMQGYLDDLLNKEFIGKTKRKNYQYLIITNKGFDFFNKLREMKDFEDTFGI
jgi:predicted transcriptional regulator